MTKPLRSVVSTPFICLPRNRPAVPTPQPMSPTSNGLAPTSEWKSFESSIKAKSGGQDITAKVGCPVLHAGLQTNTITPAVPPYDAYILHASTHSVPPCLLFVGFCTSSLPSPHSKHHGLQQADNACSASPAVYRRCQVWGLTQWIYVTLPKSP